MSFAKRPIRTLLALNGFKVVALSKSGRGKSVLLPRYITVLARKEAAVGDVPLPRRGRVCSRSRPISASGWSGFSPPARSAGWTVRPTPG